MCNNDILIKNLEFLASSANNEEISATMKELIPIAEKIDFDRISASKVELINEYLVQIHKYLIIDNKSKTAQKRAEDLRKMIYRAAGIKIPVPEIVQLW